jgi:hypothetical protein
MTIFCGDASECVNNYMNEQRLVTSSVIFSANLILMRRSVLLEWKLTKRNGRNDR